MPISGKLADRHGARLLSPFGLLLMMSGTVLLTMVEPGTARLALMGAVLLIGLGHGILAPSLMGTSYQGLDRAAIPTATTGSNILIRVGGSFGVAAIAVILQTAIRDHVPGATGNLKEATASTDTHLLAGAFTDTLWWAAARAALAFVPLLFLPRRRPRTASADQPASRDTTPDTASTH